MLSIAPVLSWDGLAKYRPVLPGPILVGGEKGGRRSLVLSRLAADSLAEGARVLWLGAQHGASPLAWLPVSEQRLDARPLRLGNEVSSWPAVNPFELDAACLAEWLAYVSEISGEEERRSLAATVSHVLADWGVGRRPWRAPMVDEGMAMLDLRIPGIWHKLEALGRLPRDFSRATEGLEFARDLSVVSGRPEDLRSRECDVVLILLSFVSHALSSGSKWLLVVEDWLDIASELAVDLASNVILDACRLGRLEVVLATQCPVKWETGGAAPLLSGSLPILADDNVSLPDSWQGISAVGAGLPPATVPSVRVLVNGENGLVWREFLTPSPAV